MALVIWPARQGQQVNQDQQGLPARIQLASARADRSPVAADDPGHIGQGLGRQRQRSAAAGVPTIWLAVLQALDNEPDRWQLGGCGWWSGGRRRRKA